MERTVIVDGGWLISGIIPSSAVKEELQLFSTTEKMEEKFNCSRGKNGPH